MMLRRFAFRLALPTLCAAALALNAGCNSLLNAWMTPVELGSFSRESTQEIRGSLSIQDTPRGVRGATEPTPDDLIPTTVAYRLEPGDVVNLFINELRARNVEDAQQAVVDERGEINLRLLGRIPAAGSTARELEEDLRARLEEEDIIYDAEVMVQFAARRGLTYTIFGNESLAVRLNRGPGVFPIQRPDFRLLDALSVSGGLSELVSEVYVFRTDRDLTDEPTEDEASTAEEAPDGAKAPPSPPPLPDPAPSDGLMASHTALMSTRLARIGLQQTQPPDEGGGSETPPELPKEGSEDEPSEIQQILDLMLANPVEDEPPAEIEPPAAAKETGRDKEVDETPLEAPSPAGENAAGAPTKWIFLNGEWIEVSPDTPVPQAGPDLPEDDDTGEAAIDWESLAEEEQEARVIRISAEGLRQGDPRYNIVVRAGDVIRLYSGDIGFYYMTGHVRRPGVFVFRPGGTVTLKSAVAASAGLDALGWPTRVTVYRRMGDREQMIQVDLDRIYAGVDPDFYLKRDDIVNIGTHPVAPFLFQLRSLTIPQMGGSITYFYRFISQDIEFTSRNLNAPSAPGLFP